MAETRPCKTCQHPTLSSRQWRKQPTPRVAREWVASTGQCRTCYRRASNPNPRPGGGVPREVVLEDWSWLHETGELSRHDPLTVRVRQAAPRMGMSPAALERALARAGVRNPTPPATTTRRDSYECDQCRHLARVLQVAQGDVAKLARRVAARPDSPRLRELLERAQSDLASTAACIDMHDTEHDAEAADDQVAA